MNEFAFSDQIKILIIFAGLTTGSEQGRIYSTRWLGVLARLGVPNIAVYGVELLVRQLMDESLVVASTALNILDEVGSVELDSFKAEDCLRI